MARKKKLSVSAQLQRWLLVLQGLLLFVLFMHPRVPNNARLIVCGGTIAFIVVLNFWSRVDIIVREKLDRYLYERGASHTTIQLAHAVLFLIEFGIAVSILVPSLLKLDFGE